MLIEDGKGTGYKAQITAENRMAVNAVDTFLQQHINQAHSELYSVVISKTPTGAADCFFYLKNESDSDLMIFSLNGHVAAADESIQIKLGDSGTATDGSANTPVNRNVGSGKTADCTCEDGVNITGLSGGSVVDEICLNSDVDSLKYRWESGLLLPKNGVLTLYAVTGALALKVTLTIGFHEED